MGFKPLALCQGPRARGLHHPCSGSRPLPAGAVAGSLSAAAAYQSGRGPLPPPVVWHHAAPAPSSHTAVPAVLNQRLQPRPPPFRSLSLSPAFPPPGDAHRYLLHFSSMSFVCSTAGIRRRERRDQSRHRCHCCLFVELHPWPIFPRLGHASSFCPPLRCFRDRQSRPLPTTSDRSSIAVKNHRHAGSSCRVDITPPHR
jgi:hypothetical protein